MNDSNNVDGSFECQGMLNFEKKEVILLLINVPLLTFMDSKLVLSKAALFLNAFNFVTFLLTDYILRYF